MSATSAGDMQDSPKGPQNGTQGQPEHILRPGEYVIPAKLAGNRLRFTLQDETHNVPILKVEAENRPETRSAETQAAQSSETRSEIPATDLIAPNRHKSGQSMTPHRDNPSIPKQHRAATTQEAESNFTAACAYGPIAECERR